MQPYHENTIDTARENYPAKCAIRPMEAEFGRCFPDARLAQSDSEVQPPS